MTAQNRSSSSLPWIVAGTGAAVLGAAIIFQAWRAQPGSAAEEKSARNIAGPAGGNSGAGIGGASGTSGKAKLNTSGTAAAGQATSDDGARISRNGKSTTISMRDVEAECVRRLGKEVLDNMINRATIQLACQERNIVVTKAEVEKEIVRIASEFKIPLEQYLQMLQAERGITPDQYRNDVIWPMLALRKLAGDEIQVTSAEIKKSFEREYGPRVKVRMILCDNQRRAQTAWQKAKEDPENFEKYVQEFSIDQASKSLDGTIPPIPRHSGSPNVEAAAFKLKPGEVSAIVQLDNAAQRYVILKCEGHTDPVVRELDKQVQAELEDQIKREKVQEQVAIVFDNLKKETRVDNYFAGTSTGGIKPSTSARTDAAKPISTRSVPKSAPADEADNPIRPASAKGSTSKGVKPAVASSDDDLDTALPASRTPAKRPTTTK
jgi:foldase protein PrsA